ncbi:adenine nucleotide alpha hydrolase family protein [Thermodesulfatator atlanticus]|uniref:hypothetical protein n=1 Tax=Thermodesulfatator atlanticus TaxID=501497 RepID=UPI0003B7B7C9|nr:hypothetical protein [Thermodesulfatator atlanticus]
MALASSLWRRLWDSFVVSTFAEAGELEEAQKMARRWGLAPSTQVSPFSRTMAAVAFAEAGEFEEAQQWLDIKETSDVKIRSRALENILENSIEAAAAAAFAEGGEPYHAVKIVARLRGKKVLAVCEGANFSERLMTQAFDLAEKMQTELYVLNIFVQTTHAKDTEHRRKWREKFQKRAAQGLSPWKERYPNVKVTQVVEFGEPEKVLKNFLSQHRGVKYILTLKEVFAEEKLAHHHSLAHFIRH